MICDKESNPSKIINTTSFQHFKHIQKLSLIETNLNEIKQN